MKKTGKGSINGTDSLELGSRLGEKVHFLDDISDMSEVKRLVLLPRGYAVEFLNRNESYWIS